jgi:hypothetical protein
MEVYVYKMPEKLKRELESDFARFLYTEGIPLVKIGNAFLQRFLSHIPGGFHTSNESRSRSSDGSSSRLTYWNLRHSLLDEENELVSRLVEERLDGYVVQLQSDGWANPNRHDHLLNILLKCSGTRDVFFIKNIYTKGKLGACSRVLYMPR